MNTLINLQTEEKHNLSRRVPPSLWSDPGVEAAGGVRPPCSSP